jgi:sensor histidine kinase YesM
MKTSSAIRGFVLFSIPIISLIVGLNLYFIDVHVEGRQFVGIISLGALVYINVVIFVVLRGLDHESQKTNEYKNANIQLELQQKHYKEMLDKNYQVRGLWHDMNNHVITMQYLIKNQACEEIEEYLLQFHNMLQNAVDHNRSGNHVVDALLNYKIKVASDNNINFVHYIAIPENLKMNSIDLSIILGNVLDNAIEGCLRDSRRDQDKKIIKFNMYYKRESLLIDIENTIDEKTIQKSGNNMVSSKRIDEDQSGYGISNVKQVLKNYEGNMVTQILEDRFKCTILIPLD